MYLHISQILRWFRICSYMGGAITTAFCISTTVASLILGTPRHGETWTDLLFAKDTKILLFVPFVTSCFGVVIDLFILLLPIIAVMPLQVPIRRKIGVVWLFKTGLV